jgi:hypothetical protein
MRIWLRGHPIVTALLLAALALAGTAGVLLLYSLDSWPILPLPWAFPSLNTNWEPSANQARLTVGK